MALDLTLRTLSPVRNTLVQAVLRARARLAGPTPAESEYMTTAAWTASFERVLKLVEADLVTYDKKHPEETAAAQLIANELAHNTPISSEE